MCTWLWEIIHLSLLSCENKRGGIFYCHQLHNCSAFTPTSHILSHFPWCRQVDVQPGLGRICMCENIDYGTFQQRVLSVMTVENVTIVILGIPTHTTKHSVSRHSNTTSLETSNGDGRAHLSTWHLKMMQKHQKWPEKHTLTTRRSHRAREHLFFGLCR